MKTYKTGMITFAIIATVLLIVAIIVTYKWMQLRKSIAKVATNTKTPTTAAVNAAVTSIQTQAAAIA